MTKIVYAGPSIYGINKSTYSNIRFLPPVSRGDLLDGIDYKNCLIGIIDGVFETQASVSHKEILFAISNGANIFGAASIGALRASECFEYGMRGVGEIFKQYHSGIIRQDDAVAIIHCVKELNYRPISNALVNMIASFNLARKESIITDFDLKELVDISFNTHFKNRIFENIVASSNISTFRKSSLLKWLVKNQVDLKKKDALELLEYLKNLDIKKLKKESVSFSTTKPFRQQMSVYYSAS